MSARRVKGEGSIYQRTEHEAPPHRVNGRELADQEGIDMTQSTKASDRRAREWETLDFEWAAAQIDKIHPSDPGADEAALEILLANSHPALVDAFNALDQRRDRVSR